MKEAWREQYPFASHTLDVPGGRMHYVDEGPRDAPVLLCVHGNPTWSFYWRALIQTFRDRYRVVAPDHLGMGLSDKPADGAYRLADHIQRLETMIEHLDLKNIIVVVHDWGGAIGLGAAGRHPARFAKLVILNTGAFPVNFIPFRIALCRIPGLGAFGVRGLNGFALAAVWMATEKGLSAPARDGLLAPYGSWADRVAIHRFVQDIPMVPEHPSFATLQGVDAGLAALAHLPTLILWGDADWCFTPMFREEFLKRLPNAEVHAWPDVGHYVMEDAPARVVPLIQEFLERR